MFQHFTFLKKSLLLIKIFPSDIFKVLRNFSFIFEGFQGHIFSTFKVHYGKIQWF